MVISQFLVLLLWCIAAKKTGSSNACPLSTGRHACFIPPVKAHLLCQLVSCAWVIN